ncbi:E3 ubiquitin-protein transferase MAEA-like isoform X2 [Oppia nitens]|nr:E3 ubiquitin-protein transferase MAEA-like isoform X2 [Oppia nitens]
MAAQQQQQQQQRQRSSSTGASGIGGLGIGTGQPQMTDLKAMEHQTLKVPYEILNKKFRSAQKNVDREISHVQTSVSELERSVRNRATPDSPITINSINDLLNGVVSKLQILKRKSHESLTDELDAANVCKKRLEHLKDYCLKTNSNETAITQWKKKRMDRMLVDHFLRSGYYESAINLAIHSQIEDLTNIDLFLISRQVEDSLRARETSRCLSWCHDNKSKLRKIKSTLEIKLRQQEFIELVRKNRRLEAVHHARKHFNSVEEGQQQQSVGQNVDLQRVMGLLAFAADTVVEPYKCLFDESRWDQIIEQFRNDNFKLYQLSTSSVFSVALQAGLSAIKTPICYKKDGTKNGDCPVCSELLNKLAAHLPYSHCSQSRLVCTISGQPLNEHNLPLVLPNGHVYGEQSLKVMAIDNNGRITCPRTKDVFDIKEAEKVFVM